MKKTINLTGKKIFAIAELLGIIAMIISFCWNIIEETMTMSVIFTVGTLPIMARPFWNFFRLKRLNRRYRPSSFNPNYYLSRGLNWIVLDIFWLTAISDNLYVVVINKLMVVCLLAVMVFIAVSPAKRKTRPYYL